MITMDKKYQTRDGRKVRILTVDRASEQGRTVIALVSRGVYEEVCMYPSDGTATVNGSHWDLVEAPVEEYRYALIANISNKDWGAYGSQHRLATDNVKATFINDELVKVEILD